MGSLSWGGFVLVYDSRNVALLAGFRGLFRTVVEATAPLEL